MKFLKSMSKVKLQKVILVATLSLIGIGAVGNFYVGTEWTKLSTKRDRLVKLHTQLDLAQSNAKQEAQNNQLREQIQAFVDGQRQKMISGDPFSWVVREISLLAEGHAVRVSALQPGTKYANIVKPKYEMFTTRIELEGAYDQIGKFIKELENAFVTGQIRSLEVASSDPTHAQCRATLELALLARPDEAATPAPKTSEGEKKSL